MVYVGTRGSNLDAFGTADGELLWADSWGGSWVESTPDVVGDTAYIGSSDLHELRAVRVADGKLRWATKLSGWPWSSPAVAHGVVYQGSLDRPGIDDDVNSFHAVDAATGKVLWSIRTGASLRYAPEGDATSGVVSSPAVGRGVVVFGALDGKVYAVGV
jgi:outer membrane protein assembly factor BamB